MKDVVGGNSFYWHERLERYTLTKPPHWSGGPTYSGPGTTNMGNSIYACPDYVRMRGEFGEGMLSYGYNDSGYGPRGVTLACGWGLGAVILDHVDPDSAGPGDVRLVREAEVLVPSDMIAAGDAALVGWVGPRWETCREAPA